MNVCKFCVVCSIRTLLFANLIYYSLNLLVMKKIVFIFAAFIAFATTPVFAQYSYPSRDLPVRDKHVEINRGHNTDRTGMDTKVRSMDIDKIGDGSPKPTPTPSPSSKPTQSA